MFAFSLQKNNLKETSLLELDAQTQLGSLETSEIEESVETGDVYDKSYFTVGEWKMYGYTCNNRTPKEERAKCRMEGNTFICVKTVGDDCVTTGHETFRGELPGVLNNKNIPVTYVVGNASKPNSGRWKNSIHIVNLNEFRSGPRKYVRDPSVSAIPAPVPTPRPLPEEPVPTPAPRPSLYYESNYFLGKWNVIGYRCDALTPQMEVVHIRYQNGRFYAVKVIGDHCVPAGKMSFDGVIPAKFYQGLTIPVNFTIGSPRYPAARQINNTVRIVDLNTFQIEGRTYYRVLAPGSPHPHGVYINMNPLVGNSSYPGPGFIKLNPKSNMRSPVRRFVIVEEDTTKPANC